METLWKRYPNRRGAMRHQAYFVNVEVVDREIRLVTKLRVYGGIKHEKVTCNEEWAKIRYKKRLRWIPARDLIERKN